MFKIGENVKCTFMRCKYESGYSHKTGKYWYKLVFKFEDERGNELEETLWQPTNKKDAMVFNNKAQEILDCLHGPGSYESILSKNRDWSYFYEAYIGSMLACKNTKVYVKTLVRYNKDGEEVCLLSQKDFISKDPDLSYGVLELSQVEEYFEDHGRMDELKGSMPVGHVHLTAEESLERFNKLALDSLPSGDPLDKKGRYLEGKGNEEEDEYIF